MLQHERVPDPGTQPQPSAIVRLQPVEPPRQAENQERRQAADCISRSPQHGELRLLPLPGRQAQERRSPG